MKLIKIAVAASAALAVMATASAAQAQAPASNSIAAKIMANPDYAKAAGAYNLRRGYQAKRSVFKNQNFLPLLGLGAIGGAVGGVAASSGKNASS